MLGAKFATGLHFNICNARARRFSINNTCLNDSVATNSTANNQMRLSSSGEILFGNVDAYLVWKLTGGPRGGIHLTGCTNASRTQLMNLETLDWDDELLAPFLSGDDFVCKAIPTNDAIRIAR